MIFIDQDDSKKSLAFVTVGSIKFYFHVQLLHTKISYLRKNKYLQKEEHFIWVKIKKILYFGETK